MFCRNVSLNSLYGDLQRPPVHVELPCVPGPEVTRGSGGSGYGLSFPDGFASAHLGGVGLKRYTGLKTYQVRLSRSEIPHSTTLQEDLPPPNRVLGVLDSPRIVY